MSQISPEPSRSPQRRNLIGGGVVIIGLAIAAGFWLSNGSASTAGECPAQAAAAAAIDGAATGELAAVMGTGEGRGYSDLAFADANGQSTSIAAFKGKALLVNFWASWCVPCREEMPALDAIATRFNSDQFEVLPINLDIGAGGLEKAQQFLDDGNFANLPLYADNTFEAFDRLKREAVAFGLPVSLILDENGCELAVLQGPAHWDTPDGDAVIEALVALKS